MGQAAPFVPRLVAKARFKNASQRAMESVNRPSLRIALVQRYSSHAVDFFSSRSTRTPVEVMRRIAWGPRQIGAKRASCSFRSHRIPKMARRPRRAGDRVPVMISWERVLAAFV